MKYLLDTDWIIHHFNDVKSITEQMEKLMPRDVAISIISVAELYEGIYFSNDPIGSQNILDEFLSSGIRIITVDTEICRIFGRERSTLRKKHQLIGDFDLLIASTAIAYNLTLLTNNRKHFEKIDALKIISL